MIELALLLNAMTDEQRHFALTMSDVIEIKAQLGVQRWLLTRILKNQNDNIAEIEAEMETIHTSLSEEYTKRLAAAVGGVK